MIFGWWRNKNPFSYYNLIKVLQFSILHHTIRDTYVQLTGLWWSFYSNFFYFFIPKFKLVIKDEWLRFFRLSLGLLPVSLVVFIFWFIHRFFPSHSFLWMCFFSSFSLGLCVCCLRCMPDFYLSVIKFGFLSPSHRINEITIICSSNSNNSHRKYEATHRKINKTQNSEKKQIIIQPNIDNNNNDFKLSMTVDCETIENTRYGFYSCLEIVTFFIIHLHFHLLFWVLLFFLLSLPFFSQ